MLKSRQAALVPTEQEPTLETVAPEYARQSAKLKELIAQQEEIATKIRELVKRDRAANVFAQNNILALSAAAAQEGKPPRMIGPSKKAADLLGEFAPPPVPAPAFLAHESKESKELRELGADSAALQEAIDLLRPQLVKAHVEGSARLCELLAPEYSQIAGRICAALVELAKADLAQRAFVVKHRNIARSTLRVVHAGSLGDPRDSQSEMSRLLQWGLECRHLDLADLPADWAARKHGLQARSFSRNLGDCFCVCRTLWRPQTSTDQHRQRATRRQE
jgi:hypothetical protein